MRRHGLGLWIFAILVALVSAPFVAYGIGWSAGALRWSGPPLVLALLSWAALWCWAAIWLFRRFKSWRWYAAGFAVGCCLAMALASPIMLYAMLIAGALFM
jgi:hypothetical protein